MCATPARAFDITENQVLVAALDTVSRAAEMARLVSEKAYDDESLRYARTQGDRARLFLQHPSLRNVSRKRPSSRAIKRTRSGRSRHSYRPALDMLERESEPIDVDHLLPYVDRRTRAQHRALLEVVDRMEQSGNRLPPFRAEEGVLYAGPVQYHHPRTHGNVERLSGITIGNLLIDVPDRLRERSRSRAQADLEARSFGKRCLVVMERADIDEALQLAVRLARG
ncbi:MAG: hypothetical protein U5R31_00120 [Acidimicrobiia bacterium]|nr:hypothetical protein [Acidimicrobiia bacterium]